jgi:hypothetical protein
VPHSCLGRGADFWFGATERSPPPALRQAQTVADWSPAPLCCRGLRALSVSPRCHTVPARPRTSLRSSEPARGNQTKDETTWLSAQSKVLPPRGFPAPDRLCERACAGERAAIRHASRCDSQVAVTVAAGGGTSRDLQAGGSSGGGRRSGGSQEVKAAGAVTVLPRRNPRCSTRTGPRGVHSATSSGQGVRRGT